MKDAPAVDEIEALLQAVELERVHPPILDGRAEQAMDRAEALSALQVDAPPGRDPEPILLVVHRDNPLGPPTLGEERIEAVERPDVEHPHPGKVAAEHRDAVAVVARGAGRVDALSARLRAKV
jgi:hypothetical protein